MKTNEEDQYDVNRCTEKAKKKKEKERKVKQRESNQKKGKHSIA